MKTINNLYLKYYSRKSKISLSAAHTGKIKILKILKNDIKIREDKIITIKLNIL